MKGGVHVKEALLEQTAPAPPPRGRTASCLPSPGWLQPQTPPLGRLGSSCLPICSLINGQKRGVCGLGVPSKYFISSKDEWLSIHPLISFRPPSAGCLHEVHWINASL